MDYLFLAMVSGGIAGMTGLAHCACTYTSHNDRAALALLAAAMVFGAVSLVCVLLECSKAFLGGPGKKNC